MSADRPEPTTSATPSGRPWALLLGAALVAVEGLALLALAVAELVDTTSGRAALGISTGLFFAVLGLGMLGCARGLALAHSWARSPVVVVQLILALTAWSLRDSPAVSALMGVVAVVVLACVMSPPAVRALASEPG